MKVNTKISLPQKQSDLLKKRATKLNCSLSEIVEQALEVYFEPEDPSQIFTENDPI